jgi:hypothetical protein
MAAAIMISASQRSLAADADLRPGDSVGPQNWERVKGMVGENLLSRIKGGYTFQIKESRPRRFP